MMVLFAQILVLLALILALLMWGFYFPHPSPVVRRWLLPRKRWPEAQIRSWLKTKRFHPAFLSYFNRDPEREPPPEEGLVAPADGLVTSAEVRDGIRYLVIALTFWDMHVQRSPAAGVVTGVESSGDGFMDGEGRDFAFLRAKNCPVQKRIALESEQYGKLAIRLITSIAARRIEVWPAEGGTITRGERVGRILLGSTVVLEMPESFPLRVSPGQRVRAGETLVAVRA